VPYGKGGDKVSELDIYHMYIAQVAELIVTCQEMNQKQYDNWKTETMEATPMEAIGFMEKIIIIVDQKMCCRLMGMGG